MRQFALLAALLAAGCHQPEPHPDFGLEFEALAAKYFPSTWQRLAWVEEIVRVLSEEDDSTEEYRRWLRNRETLDLAGHIRARDETRADLHARVDKLRADLAAGLPPPQPEATGRPRPRHVRLSGSETPLDLVTFAGRRCPEEVLDLFQSEAVLRQVAAREIPPGNEKAARRHGDSVNTHTNARDDRYYRLRDKVARLRLADAIEPVLAVVGIELWVD